MNTHRDSRCSGFSLVELTIGMALLSTILYLVNSTLVGGQSAAKTTEVEMSLTDTMRITLRRISEELRSSAEHGEDIDGDHVLDPGEDTNGNGNLEDDWQITASSITFNRRLPDGTIALPVTYRLQGNTLERLTVIDITEGPQITPIATGVADFRVQRVGNRIDVTLDLARSVGQSGPSMTRSLTASTTLRN
ncbi:MAG: type II secretion system protein J [Planctomycetota bacterium]